MLKNVRDPSEVPSIDSHGRQIDGPTDPRFAEIMQHMKPGVDLFKRTREILASVDNIRAEDDRISADDLGSAAARPTVTEFDLEHVLIEAHEINGHLVYYIQPKSAYDPEKFAGDVVIPALGAVWEQLPVEGWVDQQPDARTGLSGWVWGIMVRDLKITAMNRAVFLRRIPNEIERFLAERLAD